jgi:hypothetical protein
LNGGPRGRSRQGESELFVTATNHLDLLWLATLEAVVNRGAHEVKDVLNGVSLNLEVIRSRSANPKATLNGLELFAMTAAEQLELLSARTEAVLFLARPAREPADVAVTLKHLAALMVPAAKADGGSLSIEGDWRSAPTAAPAQATRLALASALLAFTKQGGASRCKLESSAEPVVRFSHESAGTCNMDPAVVSAISEQGIRQLRSGSDLLLVFQAQP